MQVQTTLTLKIRAACMAARTVLVWIVDLVTNERFPVFEVDVTFSAVLVATVRNLVVDKKSAGRVREGTIWKRAGEGHKWMFFGHVLCVLPRICGKVDLNESNEASVYGLDAVSKRLLTVVHMTMSRYEAWL